MSGKEKERESGAPGETPTHLETELIFIFAWRHGRVDERRDE